MIHAEKKQADVPRMKHVLIDREKFRSLKEKRALHLPRRKVQHVKDLPVSKTLEAFRPVAYNQGQLGSCTANALLHYAKMLDQNRGQPDAFEPSRNFIYSCEEALENPGKLLQDLGADVFDGCSIAHSIGMCPESDYPYLMDPTTQKITNALQVPTAKMYADAAIHKLPQATNVTNNGPLLDTIKTLINQDEPVLLAFAVYPELESAECEKTGILAMPTVAELAKPELGGHQVLCLGYDPQYLHILNSWGPNWGLSGMFMMPVEYLQATGTNGPIVDQLITIAPIPTSVIQPTPVEPVILNIAQLRSELATVVSQIQLIDSQLAASQPPAKKLKSSASFA